MTDLSLSWCLLLPHCIAVLWCLSEQHCTFCFGDQHCTLCLELLVNSALCHIRSGCMLILTLASQGQLHCVLEDVILFPFPWCDLAIHVFKVHFKPTDQGNNYAASWVHWSIWSLAKVMFREAYQGLMQANSVLCHISMCRYTFTLIPRHNTVQGSRLGSSLFIIIINEHCIMPWHIFVYSDILVPHNKEHILVYTDTLIPHNKAI